MKRRRKQHIGTSMAQVSSSHLSHISSWNICQGRKAISSRQGLRRNLEATQLLLDGFRLWPREANKRKLNRHFDRNSWKQLVARKVNTAGHLCFCLVQLAINRFSDAQDIGSTWRIMAVSCHDLIQKNGVYIFIVSVLYENAIIKFQLSYSQTSPNLQSSSSKSLVGINDDGHTSLDHARLLQVRNDPG